MKGDIVVQKDATYAVYFTCFKSGEYNIHIKLDSKPIYGSPFKAYIEAGKNTSFFAVSLFGRCSGCDEMQFE